jgi:hypothetical protein
MSPGFSDAGPWHCEKGFFQGWSGIGSSRTPTPIPSIPSASRDRSDPSLTAVTNGPAAEPLAKRGASADVGQCNTPELNICPTQRSRGGQ